MRERDDRHPHVGDKPASLADGGRRQPWTRPLSIRRASPREQTKARPRRPADHAEPAVLPERRPLQPDPLHRRLPPELLEGLAQRLGLGALSRPVEPGERDQLPVPPTVRPASRLPAPHESTTTRPALPERPLGQRRGPGQPRRAASGVVRAVERSKRPRGPPLRRRSASALPGRRILRQSVGDALPVLVRHPPVPLGKAPGEDQQQVTRRGANEPLEARDRAGLFEQRGRSGLRQPPSGERCEVQGGDAAFPKPHPFAAALEEALAREPLGQHALLVRPGEEIEIAAAGRRRAEYEHRGAHQSIDRLGHAHAPRLTGRRVVRHILAGF